MTINVPGFTFDATDNGRAWTVDGMWGLAWADEYGPGDEPMLQLLDCDGMPSNHTLSEADARHVVSVCGTGEDLGRRWDYYASGR